MTSPAPKPLTTNPDARPHPSSGDSGSPPWVIRRARLSAADQLRASTAEATGAVGGRAHHLASTPCGATPGRFRARALLARSHTRCVVDTERPDRLGVVFVAESPLGEPRRDDRGAQARASARCGERTRTRATPRRGAARRIPRRADRRGRLQGRGGPVILVLRRRHRHRPGQVGRRPHGAVANGTGGKR